MTLTFKTSPVQEYTSVDRFINVVQFIGFIVLSIAAFLPASEKETGIAVLGVVLVGGMYIIRLYRVHEGASSIKKRLQSNMFTSEQANKSER